MSMRNTDISNGATDSSEVLEIATFFIGEACYGIDILSVQEIIRAATITPVSLTPDYVEGVLNLRGQIITIIDLAARVEVPSASEPSSGHIIVVNHGNEFLGLKVDRIGDVLSASWDCVEAPPVNVSGIHRRYVKGVLKTKDRLVEILDLPTVVTSGLAY